MYRCDRCRPCCLWLKFVVLADHHNESADHHNESADNHNQGADHHNDAGDNDYRQGFVFDDHYGSLDNNNIVGLEPSLYGRRSAGSTTPRADHRHHRPRLQVLGRLCRFGDPHHVIRWDRPARWHHVGHLVPGVRLQLGRYRPVARELLASSS